MSLHLHNNSVSIFDNGRMNIGATTEPSCALNIEKPSSAVPTLKVDRQSGYASIKAAGQRLVLDSNSDFLGINYFSSNTVYIAYGGGNVGIGTETLQDVTAYTDLTLTGMIYNEEWITPTLTNGWVRYHATFNPPGYFRDKSGIVHLRGMVAGGIIGTNYPIFTLPVGYRPEYYHLQNGVTSILSYLCGIYLTPDGGVCAYNGNNGWVSLDGIYFRAIGY